MTTRESGLPEAVHMAVDYVNSLPDLLPNHTLVVTSQQMDIGSNSTKAMHTYRQLQIGALTVILYYGNKDARALRKHMKTTCCTYREIFRNYYDNMSHHNLVGL